MDVLLLSLSSAGGCGSADACRPADACRAEADGTAADAAGPGDPTGGQDSACGCGGGDSACGCGGRDSACGCGTDSAPRAQVLACRDALREQGATVSLPTAYSDTDIDEVIAKLDGPTRPDGLTFPAADGPRLVVVSAAAGQVRAVIRRMVRRYAPPPSRRPKDLPAGRTVPDLPPIGILPVDRPAEFGEPTDPAEVAKAVVAGRIHRLDLLRDDGGSVTLGAALLGGETAFAARVEVDDAVLATPESPIVACVVGNDRRYAELDGLPLVPGADPADGRVDVAVTRPVPGRSRWGRRRVHVEVLRASGRAVAVRPAGRVPYLDDGVAADLSRKRSWWVEPRAWGVYLL